MTFIAVSDLQLVIGYIIPVKVTIHATEGKLNEKKMREENEVVSRLSMVFVHRCI